jgi:RNA polymerase primary sigma factor
MTETVELANEDPKADPASATLSVDGMVMRPEKVERAASDLQADFERQGGTLGQAQFDRLVLRRNLSPPEMVALLGRIASLGITISEMTGNGDEPSVDADDNPTATGADITGRGSKKRNPYALLTHRDEVELGRRVQLALRIQPEMDPARVSSTEEHEIVRRGRAARDRIILANLRLVRFVTTHVRRPVQTLDPWDMFQEGSVGLMRAVEKFDPELGLRFSTYAMWWIRQAVFRGLDDQDRTIRLPVHRMESLRRMKTITRRLAMELGREPTIREIADGMNWSLEKTAFIQRLAQLDCISIDAPLGDDEDSRTIVESVAADQPSPFELAQNAQRTDLMRRLLEKLTPRQRLVIERRFGLRSGNNETLQQVGDDLGVTRERIRQIESKALVRLKRWVDRQLHDALL